MPSTHILVGDVRERIRDIPDASVQTCVTSPPYWGLRDYGCDGQIGLEQTPEEYVAEMVAVFREVRRCLRDDGTLWLNIGDSYASKPPGCDGVSGSSGLNGAKGATKYRETLTKSVGTKRSTIAPGLKPKDLVGIPWRVAFALQADGWFLRSDIIWAKPNPMPESVRDRPTKSHEYVFLLSKSGRYFYDADAIAEEADPANWRDNPTQRATPPGQTSQSKLDLRRGEIKPVTRNARTVWTIATQPFPGSHFAVMPPELAEKCIRAGSSERGCCPQCGRPWEREVERTNAVIKRSERTHSKGQTRASGTQVLPASSVTTGWKPSCEHDDPPVPCRVLDPFGGAGTTALVANRLGRDAVICELNHDYAQMARARIQADAPMFNIVEVVK